MHRGSHSGVFSALGVAPALGRVFTVDEDEHHQQVAVLELCNLAQSLPRRPAILGTKVLLDRKPYIVIGVMPRGFEFPLSPDKLIAAEFWVPMSSGQMSFRALSGRELELSDDRAPQAGYSPPRLRATPSVSRKKSCGIPRR